MLEELIWHGTDLLMLPRRDYVRAQPRGDAVAIVVESISDPRDRIREMVEQKSLQIPHDANAFTVSAFNPGTKIVKDDKEWCAYAVQFYKLPIMRLLADI